MDRREKGLKERVEYREKRKRRARKRDRKMVKTMITLDNVYGTNYRDNVLISKHFFE